MGTNDITGDRITSKVSKDIDTYSENIEKIFGKKKETNGGWKYEPNNEGSVIDSEDTMER
jgi:hypothetical protein